MLEQADLFEDSESTTPEALAAFLNHKAKYPVRVTLTRNRVSMVSIKFARDGSTNVRLHEQYLRAPQTVLRALRSYLRSRRRSAWGVVSEYVESIRPVEKRSKRTRLRTKGRVHDLHAIRTDIDSRFFRGRVSCRIGWGCSRVAPRRKLRSIRYGCYDATAKVIRIHPMLDDARVPRGFVEYIVFHEMLHAVVPSVRRNGRLFHHPAEFRALERSFPGLPQMHRLCRTMLGRLQK